MRNSNVAQLSRFRLLVAPLCSLGVAACSHDGGGGDDPTRLVSASGVTVGISSDGNQHVAYLLGALPSFGSKGELHVASADGKDVKVATGVSVGGFAVSPNGKGLLFALSNSTGDDASLNWVDLSQPSMTPKVLFDRGLQVQPVWPPRPPRP